MFLSPLEVVTRSDQLQLRQVTRRLYHKAQRNSVLDLKLEAFRSQASAPFTNSSECAVLLEQIRPYLDRHCSNLTLDKFNPTQRQVQQLQQKLKQLNQREQHINTIELQHVFAYFTQHYQYLSPQQYSDWSTHLTTTRLI